MNHHFLLEIILYLKFHSFFQSFIQKLKSNMKTKFHLCISILVLFIAGVASLKKSPLKPWKSGKLSDLGFQMPMPNFTHCGGAAKNIFANAQMKWNCEKLNFFLNK